MFKVVIVPFAEVVQFCARSGRACTVPFWYNALPLSVIKVWKTESSHQLLPVTEKIAAKGLAPNVGSCASSTTRVPEGGTLLVEDDEVDWLVDDEVLTVLVEDVGGTEVVVEVVLVIGVVVVVDFDNTTAAAPAMTIIMTITTAITILLIAFRFRSLLFILRKYTF